MLDQQMTAGQEFATRAALAIVSATGGDLTRAIAEAEQALAVDGAPVEEAAVLSSLAVSMGLLTGRPSGEVTQQSERALAAATGEVARPALACVAHQALALAAGAAGRSEEALAHARAGRRVLHRRGSRGAGSSSRMSGRQLPRLLGSFRRGAADLGGGAPPRRFNFGENDARGVVHLEHLKQFRTWNDTATHPLHGKVDLNRIAIVGHSRGGEGVGHASFFNRLASIKPDILTPVVQLDGSAGLGPYRFNITVAVAIAPTDRQYHAPDRAPRSCLTPTC